MIKYTLPIIFLLNFLILNAQQRDLTFYLGQAKANSPLINKTKNEGKIAELDLEQIRSVLSKPEINVEAGVLFAPIISHDNGTNKFQWVSEGADDYNGYDLASTDGGQYQAIVSINQPIFTGSKFRTFSEKTNIIKRQNENNLEITSHELEQIVNYQYILCLKSKIEIENNLLILKEMKDQLELLKKLVENAIYKQTDLMLLQIEFQNYEIENRTFTDEYKSNLADLNLICGISDTGFVDIQEIDLQIKPDTVAYSQFLKSYTLDSLTIQAEQSINDLKYKPQLNFFANAGLNAVYLPAVNRLGFSTGLTFIMNIYDGKQRKNEREKAVVNLHTIEFEKKNFNTQRTINKNKILKQIQTIEQKTSLSEELINQYDKLLEVYNKELAQGEISVMDYKNLLKDIVAKKQEVSMLKMEKLILINSYNYWNF
ncbi:MAG: TolC family protein [Bacteroidales bacterium]